MKLDKDEKQCFKKLTKFDVFCIIILVIIIILGLCQEAKGGDEFPFVYPPISCESEHAVGGCIPINIFKGQLYFRGFHIKDILGSHVEIRAQVYDAYDEYRGYLTIENHTDPYGHYELRIPDGFMFYFTVKMYGEHEAVKTSNNGMLSSLFELIYSGDRFDGVVNNNLDIYAFTVNGDVTGDFKIDLSEAIYALQIVSGIR